MGFFSGFPTRKLQDKYNHLLTSLLNILNQVIITYIEQAKLQPFKQQYHHIYESLKKLEQHKYTSPKYSHVLEPLSQHFSLPIITKPSPRRTFNQRYSHSHKNQRQDQLSQTINVLSKDKLIPRKNSHKQAAIEKYLEEYKSLTIQELLKTQPKIERKLSLHRKKIYVKNKISLIKEEDNQELDEQY